jgi:tetratricopeptide (TPR) repeat protein
VRLAALALVLVLAELAPVAAVCAQAGDARSEAVDFFGQSVVAYREGRFDDAARLLEQAYALQPEPILLYNLARAREGAGDDAGAADAYRRYLAADGTDETDASAARARLAVLDRRIEERRALEERAAQHDETDAAAHPPPPPPAREIAIAPWIVAGAGAAVLIVGGVLGGLMLDRSNAAQAATVQTDAVAAQHDAESFAIGADVCFGIGALALGVGAIWGIVDLTSTPSEHASARLRIGPSGFTIAGTF